ncbi:hypothetical protein MFIFM68171_08583 [Madurella fahalii]|uniref:RING-type domain-containing protein n=1 Tax=Madurella fahalii TaxID=1157608 RepID=A0ABQ0GKU3_9PEZI
MERRVSRGSSPGDPSSRGNRNRQTTTTSNGGTNRRSPRLARVLVEARQRNNRPGASTATLSNNPPARNLTIQQNSQSGTRRQGSDGLGAGSPSRWEGHRAASDPGPSRPTSDSGSSSSGESGSSGSGNSENNMNSETNFWPIISDWLRTRQGPKPVVNCTICTRKLVIPDLQDPEEEEDEEEHPADNWEDHVILGCGHVHGDDCMRAWALECLLGNDDPDGPGCPMCREPIYAGRPEVEAARYRALIALNHEESDSDNDSDDDPGENADDGLVDLAPAA